MFVCYIRTCMCTGELMIQVLEVVSLGPLYAVTEAMYINVCSIRIHNSQLCKVSECKRAIIRLHRATLSFHCGTLDMYPVAVPLNAHASRTVNH